MSNDGLIIENMNLSVKNAENYEESAYYFMLKYSRITVWALFQYF